MSTTRCILTGTCILLLLSSCHKHNTGVYEISMTIGGPEQNDTQWDTVTVL